MFCKICGMEATENAVFCSKCGSRIGAAKVSRLSQNKRKNIGIFVAVLFIMVAICMVWFRKNENELPEGFSKSSAKEIEFVLDRKVFFFKEERPSIYSDIPYLEQLDAYTGNWIFRQVLNEDYFNNIMWVTQEVDDNIKLIAFSGNSKNSELKDKEVIIVFGTTKNAKAPVLKSISVGEDIEISTESLVEEGWDSAEALVEVERKGGSVIAVLCEDDLFLREDENTTGY